VLSSDERAQAARFVFPRDRHRFIVSRGALRGALARYLGQSARDVEFAYAAEGTPRLRPIEPGASIQFNLSDSQGLAVFAVCRHREVGIDVEAIRSDIEADEIAERYFSPRELAELRSLPPHQRGHAFFLAWTRKEAYVTARGSGLGISLASFDVSLTPRLPAVLTSPDRQRWSLSSFEPADGFAGALVAEGDDCQLCFYDWTSDQRSDLG
jgi:4'-phosphopantetheinyl transferase